VSLGCALVLVVGGAQAQAAPKGVVGFFGSSGAGAGQFSTPRGVAVSEATGHVGHVYVVDSGNHRIQEFDPLGSFVRAWGWGVSTGAAAFEVCETPSPCLPGLAGAGAGQLSAPQGIAIDPSTGDVYVTNQNNRRIEKFEPDGDFLFAFGWGVDTGAAAVETCTTDSTCQAAPPTGANAGQFTSTFAGHVAVDPSNRDVVVADPGNRRVQRFTFAGAFRFAFGWGVDTGAPALQTCTTATTCQAGVAGTGVGQFSSNQPVRVAVDSSGSVYTVEGTTAGRRVQKFNAAATSAALFAPAHASGTSTATSPTNVAVDPSNDHVLVAKDQQVLEFDIAGGLTDTHAAGSGIPDANGMAVDSAPNGKIYLSTTPDQRLYILGDVTPPSATIGAVTEVEATTATFNGTVNPRNGALITRYRFEYSDDAGLTWTSLPDVAVGNDSDDHPVSQEAEGLEPNTEYRVRLVASREFGGGSATSTLATAFTTDPAAPSVSDVATAQVTDTTAVLSGVIDPNHSHTTYRFDYGTDASYGSSTAVDSAGSGATGVPVSKVVRGLQPNTTYHFRLVATNPAGEDAAPDATFTTDADPPPPSGRVYEMVSPVDKNGGNIERGYLNSAWKSQTGAAPSGDAVAFVSRVQFGDLDSGTLHPNYVARRGSAGWTMEGVSPPIGNVAPAGTEQPSVMGLSLDLSKVFVEAAPALTADATRLNGSWGLYMRASGQPNPYTLLSSPWISRSPAETNTTQASERFEYADATPDSRHVVFNGARQLLPEAPPDRTSASAFNAVYEWVDGSVRLASVLPPGLFVPATAFELHGGGNRVLATGSLPGDNLISDDGRRIFFTADVSKGSPTGPELGNHLWVREDGQTTRLISRSQRPEDVPDDPGDPPTGNAEPRFWAAKRSDGSVAFFRAQGALTVGAGSGSLYRWDANAEDGTGLLELSSDPDDQPEVLGPAAVSDDARSVYFVAAGLLDEDAEDVERGRPHLYLWREGEGVRYITTLDGTLASSNDTAVWNLGWRAGGRGARVSADGERLLFASYADLDDGYDTTESSAEACGNPSDADDTCRQIYLYDARTDETTCVTCVPGAPVVGDANLFGNGDVRGARLQAAPLRDPRNLSSDGRRVFFETTRQLVSADENGELDVYEWEDRDLDGDGDLRLVSSGKSSTESRFLDASLSGDSVFFETRDRLVGIDNDDLWDLYDARVGGGIPAQNPPPPAPPCEGEECQGSLSGMPLLPGVGSAGGGHGNLRPGRRPSFSVARLSRKQQARLARGRPVMMRVRVNRAGRVSATARAKLDTRMRTVARASKAARRAGTVRLRLKLSPAARRSLAREGALNVRLAVRFAGVREARTSTLRLRRARPPEERRAR
jgi:hypothetical protein